MDASVSTTATIRTTYQARAFLAPGNPEIVLSSSRTSDRIQLEAVGGTFAPSSVRLETVQLASAGTGEVDYIVALDNRAIVGEDSNRNGAEELSVSFSRVDLQTLLGQLPPEGAMVPLALSGSLIDGADFRTTFDARVVTGLASGAVHVSPNPLNPSGTMAFTTREEGDVQIRLFDASGRLVRTVWNRRAVPAGHHYVSVDGRGTQGEPLASGVYLYRIDCPHEVLKGRFTLLK
jgi:hypothetical protein